jgi:hypothetical protein
MLIFLQPPIPVRPLSSSCTLLSDSCFPLQLGCGSQRALCRSARRSSLRSRSARAQSRFGHRRWKPGPSSHFSLRSPKRVVSFLFPRAASVRFLLCRSQFSPVKIRLPPDLSARFRPPAFSGAAHAISVCHPRFVSPAKIRWRPVRFCFDSVCASSSVHDQECTACFLLPA